MLAIGESHDATRWPVDTADADSGMGQPVTAEHADVKVKIRRVGSNVNIIRRL
jgi:hypothetical protein